MTWFLGLSGLLITCAILATLTGRALIGAAGIRQLAPRSAESFAAAAVLGTAAWVLPFGWLLYAGALPASSILIALVLMCLVLALVAAKLRGVLFLAPDVRDHGSIVLALLALLTGLVYLLPIAIGNAYQPLNDTAIYVLVSEGLQQYRQVAPGDDQPAVGSARGHELVGTSIGAIFVLALAQAAIPGSRALEMLPAVSAWGTSLNTLAFYFLMRWGVRLPRMYALLGAFLLAVTPNPIHSAAAGGFLRQTYGTAAFAFSLAVLARAFRMRTWDHRYSFLLAVSYAFLLSVYNPLSPILLIATGLVAVPAVYRAIRSRRLRALLISGCLPTMLFFMLLANVELSRALSRVPVLTRTQAGWDVKWSWLEFWSFSMGTRPGGAENSANTTGIGVILALFLGGVFLVGIWRSLLKKQLALIAALAIVVLMAGYYALFAANPWTGHPGHTWSLYKLGQWGFPLVLACQCSGMALLGNSLWPAQSPGRLLLGMSILLIGALSLALNFSLASGRAARFQNEMASARPFEPILGLRRTVDEINPDRVHLVSPPESGWLPYLYASVLSPRPVIANLGSGRREYRVEPPPGSTTLYVAIRPSRLRLADGPFSGPVALVNDVTLVGIDSPNGIERRGGKSLVWIGRREATITIASAHAAWATLTFTTRPGPNLPEAIEPQVDLRTSHGHSQGVVLRRAGENVIRLPLNTGPNEIYLQSMDKAAGGQPVRESRPGVLALSDLQVRLLDH